VKNNAVGKRTSLRVGAAGVAVAAAFVLADAPLTRTASTWNRFGWTRSTSTS